MFKKNKEFTIEYEYNNPGVLLFLIIIFAFILFLYLIYLINTVRSGIFAYYLDILFFIILIIIIFGIIKNVNLLHQIRQNKIPNWNKKIIISNKNITVMRGGKKQKEIVEWKDVKYVIEAGPYLWSFYYIICVVYQHKNIQKQLELVARCARFVIKPKLHYIGYAKLVDKDTYEDIFEFLSKKTEIKKMLWNFRKDLGRMR